MKILPVHPQLWEHSKRKTPKEINVPIWNRLIPGSFLEPQNLSLKGLGSSIWSCGHTDFRGFPCYQSDIWVTIDNLLKDMLPFPVIFTLLFSQIERNVGTDIHKSLPQLPPALSLPHNPFPLFTLLTWEALITAPMYWVLTRARPGTQRLACIIYPHIPYGVLLLLPFNTEGRWEARSLRDLFETAQLGRSRNCLLMIMHTSFFLISSPWTTSVSYIIISWRTLRDLKYVTTVVWPWAIPSSSLNLSFPFCKII